MKEKKRCVIIQKFEIYWEMKKLIQGIIQVVYGDVAKYFCE
jgi:hypothetical protein